MLRQRAIYCAIVSSLLLASLAAAGPSRELMRAEELYQKTEYQQVLRLLEPHPDNGAAFELIGKAYFMLSDYKKASRALEKAVEADPNNSDYFDWLGKAFGRRAETSSIFTAWSYARTCRRYFERAVELDARNLEAIDDLFEYYLQAPGFLGGGLEKAEALSEPIQQLDAGKYHSLRARLAEKQKDFSGAEKEWRLAAELAPSHVGRMTDLARFLAKQGKYAESEAIFEQAQKMAPGNPQVLYERAKTYIQSGRNRDEARRLLLQYLESSLTPEDPPRAEAQRLLQETARG